MTRPVRRLSHALSIRKEDDLSAIDESDLPRELQPLTQATSQVMQRLEHLLETQNGLCGTPPTNLEPLWQF